VRVDKSTALSKLTAAVWYELRKPEACPNLAKLTPKGTLVVRPMTQHGQDDLPPSPPAWALPLGMQQPQTTAISVSGDASGVVPPPWRQQQQQ
jgi:hypothetical protein